MKADARLYGKVILSGIMHVITGLHIGALSDSMSIGGVDSPVVRDPVTNYPYIPGSSLKGKLRSLMERTDFTRRGVGVDVYFARSGGQKVKRHECTNPKCPVCRLFGATAGQEAKEEEGNLPARLAVRDLRLTDDSAKVLQQLDTGLYMTEWKSENGLDRLTAAANPRQLERVPAGAEFCFEWVYTVVNPEELVEDLRNLLEHVRMLEDDALGGHGSRGYGQVRFTCQEVVVKTLDCYRQAATPTVFNDFPDRFPTLGQLEAIAAIFEKAFAESA